MSLLNPAGLALPDGVPAAGPARAGVGHPHPGQPAPPMWWPRAHLLPAKPRVRPHTPLSQPSCLPPCPRWPASLAASSPSALDICPVAHNLLHGVSPQGPPRPPSPLPRGGTLRFPRGQPGLWCMAGCGDTARSGENRFWRSGGPITDVLVATRGAGRGLVFASRATNGS